MTQERWTEVDRLLDGLLVGSDPALEAALAGNAAGGLPAIDLSPTQGKLLHLLARLAGARRILELGALGGYSTIWLARALPPGRTVDLPRARPRLCGGRPRQCREGRALGPRRDQGRAGARDALPKLAAEDGGPFDLVFIDADKEGTPAYFDWALALTKPGSLIVVDNVVRGGAILEPDHADSRVRAMRSFVEQLAAEPRVSATVIQTVGSKGYDGFAVAIVG